MGGLLNYQGMMAFKAELRTRTPPVYVKDQATTAIFIPIFIKIKSGIYALAIAI